MFIATEPSLKIYVARLGTKIMKGSAASHYRTAASQILKSLQICFFLFFCGGVQSNTCPLTWLYPFFAFSQDGGTALLAACQYGHAKVVETLLKHGANIHDQLYVSYLTQIILTTLVVEQMRCWLDNIKYSGSSTEKHLPNAVVL